MNEQIDNLVSYWNVYFSIEDSLELELQACGFKTINVRKPLRYFVNRVADKKSLHLDLMPVHYAGNLFPEKGKIFVLSLNPGLSIPDYYANSKRSDFRTVAKRAILIQDRTIEYPNVFFDPKFFWHPGAIYWRSKFNDIFGAYMQAFPGKAIDDVYREFSNKFVFIELIPFHSKNSPLSCNKMECVKVMREYAKALIRNWRLNKDFLIIVLKGASHWQLPRMPKGHSLFHKFTRDAQAASFGLHTKQAQKILRVLLNETDTSLTSTLAVK